MTLNDVINEFHQYGRLSDDAVASLRSHLRSEDPYPAISVAADARCISLQEEIATLLESQDAMVRWNAAATLFTRFRCVEYANKCIVLAASDSNSMVRSVALCGLGEMMRQVADGELRRHMAELLDTTAGDSSALHELRGSAYEGILAALAIPPDERLPAHRLSDPDKDIDVNRIGDFRDAFL